MAPTTISKLSFVGSLVSVFSFWCWKHGHTWPVFYNIGQFWAEWFFHDYSTPGRTLPNQKYALDGPPLINQFNPVLKTTQWPYSSGTYEQETYHIFGEPITFVPFDTEDMSVPTGTTKIHLARKNDEVAYTPIKGMYGVDPHEPKASFPNSYIVHRVMGKGVELSDAKDMNWSVASSVKTNPYNKDLFTEDTPFTAGSIGPGEWNNPDWPKVNQYQVKLSDGTSGTFLPPYMQSHAATSYKGTAYLIPGHASKLQSFWVGQRSYSGLETNDYNNPGFVQSLEASSIITPRAPWSYSTSGGGTMPYAEGSLSNKAAVWQGESAGAVGSWYGQNFVTPEFFNPYDSSINLESETYQRGWGNNDIDATAYSGKPPSGETSYVQGLGPFQVQYAYINDFLTQDDLSGITV